MFRHCIMCFKKGRDGVTRCRIICIIYYTLLSVQTEMFNKYMYCLSFIDDQYYVPLDQIELPPKERMLRNIDELFLARLKVSMEKLPNGAYEPLFLHVKGLDNKADFNPNELTRYSYEVLGGTHNMLATKALSVKYPKENNFKGRYAKLFVGLTDDEALWLASRHNKIGSFRHEMTFQD